MELSAFIVPLLSLSGRDHQAVLPSGDLHTRPPVNIVQPASGQAAEQILRKLQPQPVIPNERLADFLQGNGDFKQPSADSKVSLEKGGLEKPSFVVPLPRSAHKGAKKILNLSPMFGPEGPYYKDVRQGQAGDCYLMALLASIAKHQPSLLQTALSPIDRTETHYAVKYFDFDTQQPRSLSLFDTSYVDEHNNPLYAGNRRGTTQAEHVSWVKLLENWFAKMQEQYHLLTDYVGIDGIAYGGWPDIPYKLLTGEEMEKFKPQTLDEFSEVMHQSNEDHVVVLATKPDTFSELILPGQHAYAVLSANDRETILFDPDGRTIEILTEELFPNVAAAWVGSCS